MAAKIKAIRSSNNLGLTSWSGESGGSDIWEACVRLEQWESTRSILRIACIRSTG